MGLGAGHVEGIAAGFFRRQLGRIRLRPSRAHGAGLALVAVGLKLGTLYAVDAVEQ
ncbi:hypothetical protein D3C78_1193400 [compost metagenome]